MKFYSSELSKSEHFRIVETHSHKIHFVVPVVKLNCSEISEILTATSNVQLSTQRFEDILFHMFLNINMQKICKNMQYAKYVN